jgi:hypothetical protein
MESGSAESAEKTSENYPEANPFRFSPAVGPPLRIGILLDTPKLSAFFARIIEDIQGSNFANLELLVFRKKAQPVVPESPSRSVIGTLKKRLLDPRLRKTALYDLYLRLDRRTKPPNHPQDFVDCSSLFAGIESIEVEPIGKKFVQRFPPDAIEKIQSKKLDVLLRFGFNILHGEILTSARYGVWSYHHGDNEFYRGGPPHFWELYEKAPLSGVILQVLTEELDGGVVLCKSLFATQPTVMVSRNRFAPYWGSTDLVIRKLNELHQFGWDYVKERAVPAAAYKGKRKIYRSPTNAEIVRWLGPIFLKKSVQYPFRKKKVQHWRIGVRVGGKRLLDSPPGDDLEGFKWIEPDKGQFWADPFLIEHENKTWMFFEDFSYRQSRAWISCAEISADGGLISPARCLDNPGRHYSYPHVFRSGSDLFMVPEARDSRSVDLYRCLEFPSKWVLERTLLHGKFVDTTIWQQGETWWLLTTRADPEAGAGSLLLFFSDSLDGEWQFHPANPISTDIRNNRGAGRVFQYGHRWLRPSQSCCPTYGYSFSLNEITEISRTRYTERLLKTVIPSGGLCGVHTYNFAVNIEVIDGATMTSLKKLAP